jgi:predicted ATP-grasp superfamily ATP-dependent carboligase
MHVLVTDDAYKVSLGIVRSLGRKGIRVSVLAESAHALASYSRYCQARYLVPPLEQHGFITALTDIVRRVHFDLIIPVTYASTVSLAQHKTQLSSLARLEVVDSDTIRLAAEKPRAYSLALTLGIPVPRTAYPAGLDDAVRFSSEVGYPVVIKARRETSGYTVRYASSRSELTSAYRDLCEQRACTDPLIQEFIPGYGCGFFALYQDGACKRIFMHRRIRENPPSGGASTCAISFYDPELKDHGTRLLDALRWHGVAMAEFRYDVRNRSYKLMEVNPKFWGSLDLALAAGVDFPYYLCQMAQGEVLEYSEKYDRNLRYHWPLSGDIHHAWRRPASIGAILRDSLNPMVKSNIWLRDIRPNLRQAFSWASR